MRDRGTSRCRGMRFRGRAWDALLQRRGFPAAQTNTAPAGAVFQTMSW